MNIETIPIKHATDAHFMTGLCCWEHLMQTEAVDFTAYRSAFGICETRASIPTLARWVDQVYHRVEQLNDICAQSLPFDFEFVPFVVDRVTWDDTGPDFPDIDRTAKAWIDKAGPTLEGLILKETRGTA